VECTKVLVVDQELGVYEAIRLGLNKHGYELHTTAALPRALALARAHHYQVAFVDVGLVCNTPFLTELWAELPELFVILVSTPDCVHLIPTYVLDMPVNVIWKPLALEPCRLFLDRTIELATLRSQLRQHRQLWSDVLTTQSPLEKSSRADNPTIRADNPTMVSFDVVFTTKLRYMVRHWKVVGRGTLHRAVLSYVERLLLTTVLTECRGNQLRAADILGINRNTLRKKLREFGISISRGGNGSE
jgi:DNA-binding protein Fis